MELTVIQRIVIWALPILFAITIHEAAHGWIASKFGDKTALILGRVTLNPLKHIDLLGTIIIPLIMITISNVVFGWAKPVPINPANLKNPRRDMIFVSIAGPLSNLLMAFMWGAIAKLGMILMAHGISGALPISLMGQAGISINIVLMVLNLIPIPPLDGSQIVAAVLPKKMAIQYQHLGFYGFFILLALLYTGVLSFILSPFLIFFHYLIYFIFKL